MPPSPPPARAPTCAAAPATAAAPRGRTSTFHVDLGPALKAAVLAAAERRGVRPSDWVRDTLSRALADAADPSGRVRPPGRATAAVAAAVVAADTRTLPLPGYDDWPAMPVPMQPPAWSPPDRDAPADDPTPRVVGIHLAPADIAWLDELVTAGGFRSRPAALRFLLRTVRPGQSSQALATLPRAVTALMASNEQLQLALRRLAQLMKSEDVSRADLDASHRLRLEVRQQLEEVARVLAVLRPLLASGPAHLAKG